MLLPTPRTLTCDEFLAWEEAQELRHEFVDGEIFAMTGGTLAHNTIGYNLTFVFKTQLRARGCSTFHESVKVRAGEHVFYPDVVVSCAPQQFDRSVIDQPAVIVEVLSPSTASYDRSMKWTRYQRHLPSLHAYLLVAQDSLRVDVFRRTAHGWDLGVHTGPDAVFELDTPPCRIALADIYDGLLDLLPSPT